MRMQVRAGHQVIWKAADRTPGGRVMRVRLVDSCGHWRPVGARVPGCPGAHPPGFHCSQPSSPSVSPLSSSSSSASLTFFQHERLRRWTEGCSTGAARLAEDQQQDVWEAGGGSAAVTNAQLIVLMTNSERRLWAERSQTAARGVMMSATQLPHVHQVLCCCFHRS